jgi:hypothetical protein
MNYSTDDFSERVRSTHPAKQHAHKLPPAGKSFRTALRIMFLHDALKLHPWKQLQQLAEYATKYTHVEPSFGFLFFPELLYQIRAHLLNLFWTRVIFPKGCYHPELF